MIRISHEYDRERRFKNENTPRDEVQNTGNELQAYRDL